MDFENICSIVLYSHITITIKDELVDNLNKLKYTSTSFLIDFFKYGKYNWINLINK